MLGCQGLLPVYGDSSWPVLIAFGPYSSNESHSTYDPFSGQVPVTTCTVGPSPVEWRYTFQPDGIFSCMPLKDTVLVVSAAAAGTVAAAPTPPITMPAATRRLIFFIPMAR